MRQPPLGANSPDWVNGQWVSPRYANFLFNATNQDIQLINFFLFLLTENRKQKTVLKSLPQHQQEHQAHAHVQRQRELAQQL
jgi:GR25 family glycosyltransferase involved in LPS biosynthesis